MNFFFNFDEIDQSNQINKNETFYVSLIYVINNIIIKIKKFSNCVFYNSQFYKKRENFFLKKEKRTNQNNTQFEKEKMVYKKFFKNDKKTNLFQS